MLKLSQRPKFRHKVTARVPIDGGFREEVFGCTFQLASDPDASLAGDTLKEAFLRDIIVELHDLADDKGNAIEYSHEVRDAALALPWARMALLSAYFEAILGARLKN
jgi:hypothetical protein